MFYSYGMPDIFITNHILMSMFIRSDNERESGNISKEAGHVFQGNSDSTFKEFGIELPYSWGSGRIPSRSGRGKIPLTDHPRPFVSFQTFHLDVDVQE
jgi:hypothetical protein